MITRGEQIYRVEVLCCRRTTGDGQFRPLARFRSPVFGTKVDCRFMAVKNLPTDLSG